MPYPPSPKLSVGAHGFITIKSGQLHLQSSHTPHCGAILYAPVRAECSKTAANFLPTKQVAEIFFLEITLHRLRNIGYHCTA